MADERFLDQSGKFYFHNPQLWESIRDPKVDKEVGFLDSFYKKYRVKRVLDIGCGSGIHANRLAVLGYECTGLDLNEHMVEYARSRYGEHSKFVQGDMRDMNKGSLGTFNAVMCLCTTFCYNTSNREIRSTLASISDITEPEGLLVVETFNSIAFFRKKQLMESFFLEDPTIYNQFGLKLQVNHEVEEENQLVREVKQIFDLNGGLIREDLTRFRMFFPQEMCFYLETYGYHILGQYGRFDEDYTALDRTRLITVAKKQ